jgi:hypothetical protein
MNNFFALFSQQCHCERSEAIPSRLLRRYAPRNDTPLEKFKKTYLYSFKGDKNHETHHNFYRTGQHRDANDLRL